VRYPVAPARTWFIHPVPAHATVSGLLRAVDPLTELEMRAIARCRETAYWP
jgi:hypothetical protein